MGIAARIASAVRQSMRDEAQAFAQMSAPVKEYAYVRISSMPGRVWRFDSYCDALSAVDIAVHSADCNVHDRIRLAEEPVVVCVNSNRIVHVASVYAYISDSGELRVSVKDMQYFVNETGDIESGRLRLLRQPTEEP